MVHSHMLAVLVMNDLVADLAGHPGRVELALVLPRAQRDHVLGDHGLQVLGLERLPVLQRGHDQVGGSRRLARARRLGHRVQHVVVAVDLNTMFSFNRLFYTLLYNKLYSRTIRCVFNIYCKYEFYTLRYF